MDQFVGEQSIDHLLCEGDEAREPPDLCPFKRLSDDGRPSEVWEIRTAGDEGVRIFGVFVERGTLVLTHGAWRRHLNDRKGTYTFHGAIGDCLYYLNHLGLTPVHLGHRLENYI